MFWAMYQFVPTVKVRRRAALISGLTVGIAWELLNNIFTWYLSSSLVQFRLVYGSLGTIVALLLHVYLTASLVLIGAHLTASIQSALMKENE